MVDSFQRWPAAISALSVSLYILLLLSTRSGESSLLQSWLACEVLLPIEHHGSNAVQALGLDSFSFFTPFLGSFHKETWDGLMHDEGPERESARWRTEIPQMSALRPQTWADHHGCSSTSQALRWVQLYKWPCRRKNTCSAEPSQPQNLEKW